MVSGHGRYSFDSLGYALDVCDDADVAGPLLRDACHDPGWSIVCPVLLLGDSADADFDSSYCKRTGSSGKPFRRCAGRLSPDELTGPAAEREDERAALNSGVSSVQ